MNNITKEILKRLERIEEDIDRLDGRTRSFPDYKANLSHISKEIECLQRFKQDILCEKGKHLKVLYGTEIVECSNCKKQFRTVPIK